MRFLIHTTSAPNYLHVVYLDRSDPAVELEKSVGQNGCGRTNGIASAQVVTRRLHGMVDFSFGEFSIEGQGFVYAVAITAQPELEAWVLDWMFDGETTEVEFERRTFAPASLGSRKLSGKN